MPHQITYELDYTVLLLIYIIYIYVYTGNSILFTNMEIYICVTKPASNYWAEINVIFIMETQISLAIRPITDVQMPD